MILFPVSLAILIVALAIFILHGKDDFAAIVGFIVYGVLLSLAWMWLYAPDVALTEASVGSGVTGALLLGVYARMRRMTEKGLCVEDQASGFLLKGVAAFFSCVVTAALVLVFFNLPHPAPTLAPSVAEPLESIGLKNPVTAVLMSYRALDTMLEKAVLFFALIAVWSLSDAFSWGKRPAYGGQFTATGPLLFLSRIAIPFGLLAGIYLFWVGADAPGGAFAGGAVLSAMGLLGFLAGMYRPPSVSIPLLRIFLVLGIAVFLLVGMGGFLWASDFLAYPQSFPKGTIVCIEIAMTLSIGFTLALLVTGPPDATRRESSS